MSTLSKSAALAALQCSRRQWLTEHEPRAPLSDVAALKRKNKSALVAAFLRTRSSDIFSPQDGDWPSQLAETEAALKQGIRELHGACFEIQEIRVRVDHLKETGDGWEATEVRGAGAAKAAHTEHAAVVAFVLEKSGLVTTALKVAHVNTRWNGTTVTERFAEVDVTEAAHRKSAEFSAQLARLQDELAGPLPQAQTGPHCKRPFECRFFSRCHPEPEAHGLDELYRVKAKVLGKLRSSGIDKIADIPDDIQLPDIAGRQRTAVMTDQIVVAPGLLGALDEIRYPAVYIDFEAIQPALPPWPGCKPFGVIPVQVSLHRVEADGTTAHSAWLAQRGTDPRPELASFLSAQLADTESLIAYHASFEQNVLGILSRYTTDTNADVLLAARDRFVDLLPIVRNFIYHPSFHGRFSLKVVVEALLPHLSYTDLRVQRGDDASLFLQDFLLHRVGESIDGDVEYRRDLLAYCERDTLVMVHLERLLRELAQQSAEA